jgi:hypothetical protein
MIVGLVVEGVEKVGRICGKSNKIDRKKYCKLTKRASESAWLFLDWRKGERGSGNVATVSVSFLIRVAICFFGERVGWGGLGDMYAPPHQTS